MLEPAGSFDHDALEAVSGEAFEERCDRLFVVGNAEREVPYPGECPKQNIQAVAADRASDGSARPLNCDVRRHPSNIALLGSVMSDTHLIV